MGDTALLTAAPLDDIRNPLDPVGLQLLVTLPDGTTSAPITPDQDGPGQYSHPFVTTQAGRHLARWSGAGFAYTEVFSVWPPDPGMLFDLATARRLVGSVPASRNEDLLLYIAAVTPVLEDICGPLLAAQGTVSADGGRATVFVPPESTVLSVTENGVVLDPGVYTVNAAAGIVYAGSPFAPRRFLRGRQNVSVAYRAGGVIPTNVMLAAQHEFRFLWETAEQSVHAGQSSPDEDDMAYTPSGFAVPRKVIELCAGAQRGPVVA